MDEESQRRVILSAARLVEHRALGAAEEARACV